jgi:hypothetical protein
LAALAKNGSHVASTVNAKTQSPASAIAPPFNHFIAAALPAWCVPLHCPRR